jgi:hypothetical protein
MASTVAEIKSQIRELSLDDKADLIRSIIAELDGPPDPETRRAWLLEAQRRHQEVLNGIVTPVSGDRVFANLRARLKQ